MSGYGDGTAAYFASIPIVTNIAHHMSWHMGDDRSWAGFAENRLCHDCPLSSDISKQLEL